MIAAGLRDIEFITVDCDANAGRESRAPVHITLDESPALPMGTGGDPEKGRLAALESRHLLQAVLHGSDMVFIVAGLGGGTGSGAAPVVAEIAGEAGALVIGMVTYPFRFEGEKRLETARLAIHALRSHSDTLIVIPNERLLQMAQGSIGFHETYRLAHEIWFQSVNGVAQVVNRPGLVNVDFADVRTIVSEGGAAVIATGRAAGPDRARRAAAQATHSDLLGITIDGARGILFNISGGSSMSLQEVEQAAAVITRRADPDALVIFGATVDESLEDELQITVIATGFGVMDPRIGAAEIPVAQATQRPRGLQAILAAVRLPA
jgi:cell division protein FtsZ